MGDNYARQMSIAIDILKSRSSGSAGGYSFDIYQACAPRHGDPDGVASIILFCVRHDGQV
jgi:hypothetical protein